ncbi:DUF4355 domain-containing protein [Finegoldia magna]|uniref:DUF4355 domain-containing protein n=1 Tax=Finegoldia magna TaxID=1260 RepID=UPI00370DC39F
MKETSREEINLKGPIPMDLQLFADEETEQQETQESEQQEQVTYTQEEFDKQLQSEADKRVTEALKTAKAKWESDYKDKLKKEKDEAARLAKMSAEDRAKEEFEKQKQDFEAERKQFERDRLELQVKKDLNEQGLNESFSSFLIGEDADSSLANIKSFKGAWDKALSEAVKEKLKGEPPKASPGQSETQDVFERLKEKYK